MTRLFSADIEPPFEHLLDHIPVADPGPEETDALPFEKFFEPEIAHHRGDDGPAFQLAGRMHVGGAYPHDAVAVDDPALFVAEQRPVAVAVVGDPDIGLVFEHRAPERRHIHGTARQIYIGAVRPVMYRDHLCAEFPRYAGDLRVLGGDEDAVHRPRCEPRRDAVGDEGPAAQPPQVLPGDALGAAPRGHDRDRPASPCHRRRPPPQPPSPR